MTAPTRRKIFDLITLVFLAPFAFLFGVYAYAYFDREPPWIRLSGTIEPVHAGGYFAPHWRTTPLTRPCPGTLQVEIISGKQIWPVLQGSVSSALVVGQTEYDPKPWKLDRDIPPGPAIYRVTSFWYCNWAQKSFGLPIIQVGPDIPFEVRPETK